jgi:hypothetical protein
MKLANMKVPCVPNNIPAYLDNNQKGRKVKEKLETYKDRGGHNVSLQSFLQNFVPLLCSGTINRPEIFGNSSAAVGYT